MSEAETLRVDCAGARASVEIRGDGPDVVMVGAASPMHWSRAASLAVAARGYRVVDFDYGVGHPEPEPRTALQQVDDVRAVMEAAGVADAAIVGLSRGAVTAYGVAASSPDVKTLTLVFPVAGFADTFYRVDPEPEPMPGESDAEFTRRILARVFSSEFLDRRWDEAVALVTSPAGSVERVARADEVPLPDDLMVDVPVLVIEGGEDEIVTGEHPARYVRHLPDAHHIVIENAPHGWLMEDPVGFARILDEFLTAV